MSPRKTSSLPIPFSVSSMIYIESYSPIARRNKSICQGSGTSSPKIMMTETKQLRMIWEDFQELIERVRVRHAGRSRLDSLTSIPISDGKAVMSERILFPFCTGGTAYRRDICHRGVSLQAWMRKNGLDLSISGVPGRRGNSFFIPFSHVFSYPHVTRVISLYANTVFTYDRVALAFTRGET